jgi:hypothetical protein
MNVEKLTLYYYYYYYYYIELPVREVSNSSTIGYCVEEWVNILDWKWHILSAVLDLHNLVMEHPMYNKTKEG